MACYNQYEIMKKNILIKIQGIYMVSSFNKSRMFKSQQFVILICKLYVLFEMKCKEMNRNLKSMNTLALQNHDGILKWIRG